LQFLLSMRASLFLIVLRIVIPTQRGDHIFKVNSREVNRCDAEMWKYHWETKQKHVLSDIDECAGCVKQRTGAMEQRQCSHAAFRKQ
jgi:hypothetical protein